MRYAEALLEGLCGSEQARARASGGRRADRQAGSQTLLTAAFWGSNPYLGASARLAPECGA